MKKNKLKSSISNSPKNSYPYGDNDIPRVDVDPYANVEPLPESTRPRKDGPGGEE